MSDFPTSSINSNNPKAIRNMVIPTVIESEGRGYLLSPAEGQNSFYWK